VILRERDAARRATLAMTLRAVPRPRAIRLLIANDAALAMRIGADGIHLSEAHAKDASHWRALRPGWIITAAAHSLAAARVLHVDALFIAPVFATASHPGGAFLGSIKLRIIAQQSLLPVYALGGIDAETARSLEGARLAGLAAVGAFAI
jgi:thiamine-phosphate pyrophosphorylase